MEGGQTFWESLPRDMCVTKKYEVLYQGLANKIYDEKVETSEVIYSLITDDTVFSLAEKERKKYVDTYLFIQNILSF